MPRLVHPIPDVLIPQGDICVPLVIPANSDYIALLVRAIRLLTLDRNYVRDANHDAIIVRQQWMERTYLPLIEALANATECVDPQPGDCLAYPSSASFITYSPQNPFSEIGLVPSGYLTPPFTRWADFVPLAPAWLSTWLANATTGLTGYEADDIIVDISSFPLLANWSNLLSGVMPQIAIDVSGDGIVELHLLNFPLGGRAVITVDVQPNIADIFLGILGGAETLVELDRDLVSLPIESDSTSIEEVEITDGLAHTIYVTFIPVLNDSLIPINFGGGLRKVVTCGLDTVIMPIVEDIRINNCMLEKFINNVWIPVEDLNICIDANTTVQTLVSDVSINQADITNNDQDIAQNTSDIQDQDTNIYPTPPTQATDNDGTCGAAWKIAEELEALCQQALTDAQNITLLEFLDGLMAGGGWQSSLLVQLWNLAFANANPTLGTELTTAISDVAEILYCADLDKATAKTDIAASATISADAKTFYDAAIDSVTDGKMALWVFIGAQDTSRDCSSFCPSGWCYNFDFATQQGWVPWSVAPHGVWSAGQWNSGWEIQGGIWDERIYIEWGFDNIADISKITIDMNVTGILGSVPDIAVRIVNPNGSWEVNMPYTLGQQTIVWTPNPSRLSASRVIIILVGGSSGDGDMDVAITSVKLEGDLLINAHTNGDNC